MEKNELKAKIYDVMMNYPIGSVATINSGRPWVRYMATQPQEDLSVMTTSLLSSRKISQIKENSSVHVAFGADPEKWMIPYVNIIGHAEVLTDLETKKKCWQDMHEQFYDTPENPDFCVIKIVPETIEYMDSETMRMHTYTVS